MALTINKYYNGPDTNLNLEPQPTQSSEEISIPAASFPSPEKTGRYLLEAWNMIDDEKRNLSIDEKTQVYLKWAETIS